MSWRSDSTEPAIKTGTATFKSGSTEISLKLESFSEAASLEVFMQNTIDAAVNSYGDFVKCKLDKLAMDFKNST